MSKDKYHTYMVQRNKYTINSKGEVIQIGGDWYSCYTSKGEVTINEDVIAELVKRGASAQEIERAGKKINDTFKLSGSLILKRGTPFGDVTVYRENNGLDDSLDEEETAIDEELDSLVELSELQAKALQETQDRIKKLSKKIISKKKR